LGYIENNLFRGERMKVFMILVVLFISGCVLDEAYQEEQSKHITTWELDHPEPSVEYIYIDCEGNVITDPDIIDTIKSN
jgi:hypothetical protein